MLVRLCVVFSLLGIPAIGLAQKSAAKWTVDDFVDLKVVNGFRVSPDGQWVVWVQGEPDEDKGESVGQLFRANVASKRVVQLTRGSDACLHPRWSPDGRYLAFLSDRPAVTSKSTGKSAKSDKEDERTQIWLMETSGGEPWTLTEGKRDVVTFDWIDNDTILFSAKEDASQREKEQKKAEDQASVIDDPKTTPPVRLFSVDVESGKIRRRTTNTDWILSLDVSPDGKRAVAIHNRSLSYIYDNKVKPVVMLHDLAAETARPIFEGPAINVVQATWSADGKAIYATSHTTDHPRYVSASISELYQHELASGKEEKINLQWERGLALHIEDEAREGVIPVPGGFLALLADGVRPKAARYTKSENGWKRDWLMGEHSSHINALQASADGKRLLYAHSSASSPSRWYHAALDGKQLAKPTSLVDPNEKLRKKPKARVEVTQWKGANEASVEGLLYYPHDYQEGKAYPLVVMIHGGPFGADLDAWDESWAYPVQLYCQRGAFVLRPNYHGSSGYGLPFAASIRDGKYYELPLIDIERGIDALIGRKLVDRQRLATMGWSNGAILSAALITRNPRYKAASLGAGGAEWVADWGFCEFGASFSNYYLGKSPIEDPQLYIKLAPLYQFDKIRTPVILFQGDADRAVPPHHAWLQFRTLQSLGRADVRLVMFPDEEHGLKKTSHLKRKLSEELAWFDRHLFGKTDETSVVVKKESPLAHALKRQQAKRDASGRYGETHQGILIPEMVPHEGKDVGRFEVTAAQFAQFDKTYKVEPGRENYPATGIAFEQARAYCRWLSERTGQRYRLPNETEAEDWYDEEDEDDGENTLSHWAGYTPNPEDAAQLLEQVKKLPGKAPLLQEVGRFRARGESGVFDLGGNAAEWITMVPDCGHAAGGSAILVRDKNHQAKPPAEYIGFRVVRVVKVGTIK